MTHRYFADQPIDSPEAFLTGPEAHHLVHVMRGAVGQEVVLFDGRGSEFRARVARVERGRVELAILEQRHADRELPGDLVVGVALPKGDRQRWLVEKCVELGVGRLVPLIARRGVAQPTGSAVQRLRRQVIEASKQCGRNRLMEVDEPVESGSWLATRPGPVGGLLGDPLAPPPDRIPPCPLPVWLAVGPEGGWTEEERTLARECGWHPLALGPRTLRVETAAVVMASWWSAAGRSAPPGD